MGQTKHWNFTLLIRTTLSICTALLMFFFFKKRKEILLPSETLLVKLLQIVWETKIKNNASEDITCIHMLMQTCWHLLLSWQHSTHLLFFFCSIRQDEILSLWKKVQKCWQSCVFAFAQWKSSVSALWSHAGTAVQWRVCLKSLGHGRLLLRFCVYRAEFRIGSGWSGFLSMCHWRQAQAHYAALARYWRAE